MTVIPNTLKSGNVRKETPAVQTTNYMPAFKANEMEKDSFVPRPKESWINKNRDTIGALAGVITGEAIWHSLLRKRVEGMKNITNLKIFVLNVALDGVLAIVAGKIALEFGKNN